MPCLGNPVTLNGPWFTIWQYTRREPGQAALICLTSVKKKSLNWLYKLYSFFSTGRFKCQCVLCLARAFPGEWSPLKGFWRQIKAFSSRGGRNTIAMLSSLHTPTNGVLLKTSSALRWKACCVSRLLQNGCNRFSLLELSEARRPHALS